MEDQKDRFRKAVEELQTKLHETVAGRKKLLDLRQQDMNQQEDTINRLQVLHIRYVCIYFTDYQDSTRCIKLVSIIKCFIFTFFGDNKTFLQSSIYYIFFVFLVNAFGKQF